MPDPGKQTERANDTASHDSHAQRLCDTSRRAQHEATALARALEEALTEAGALVREQMDQRPYVVLAAAVGAGYVLGGGLTTRLTRAAINVGGRLAIAIVAREVSAHLRASSDANGGEAVPE